ncbi:MAG: NrtA/SsuA/CpmA family ABC transporter substrate-binding protein [Nitrospirota bacterium]
MVKLKLFKIIICIAAISALISPMPGTAHAAKPEDNPYYSKYKFEKSDSYMNIGFQPLYLPSGLIATVMSRDLTLKRKLGEMGLTVIFYRFLNGQDSNKFFLSDDLQAGIIGDMPAITAAAKKDVIIPSIMQQSFTAIVSRRYEFIDRLKGKRIGYVPGSTAHYALLKTLTKSGMTEKDVTLVPLENIEMADALINKKISAFSVWEPTVSLTLMNYPQSVAIHKTLTFGYISFSKEFYIKRPEVVREVVAAQIRATKWIKSGRGNLFLAATWTQANIKSLVGDKFKITPEQIAEISIKDMMWQSEVPVIPEKSLKKDGQITSIIEFLKGQGQIDSTVDAEKIIRSFDKNIVYDVINMPGKYNLDEFNYDTKANQ